MPDAVLYRDNMAGVLRLDTVWGYNWEKQFLFLYEAINGGWIIPFIEERAITLL